MNPTLKRHLISAGVTFLTGAAMVILPVLDTLTLQDLQGGAIVGIFFTVIRAGVKSVIEYFIAQYSINH